MAEWVRMFQKHGKAKLDEVEDAVARSAGVLVQLAPKLSSRGRKGEGRPEGGVRAITREHGLEHTDVHRSIKIDSIAPEAKQAARAVGLASNQSALLKVAAAPKETQVKVVAEMKVQKDHQRASPKTTDASDELADMLVEHIPSTSIPAFLSLYQTATMAAVVKAIRRKLKERGDRRVA